MDLTSSTSKRQLSSDNTPRKRGRESTYERLEDENFTSTKHLIHFVYTSLHTSDTRDNSMAQDFIGSASPNAK